MKINYKVVYLAVFLLSSLTNFAQQRTISGVVTDSDNLPIPGVNIIVQGTNRGTLSDFDGNYFIKVAQGIIIVNKTI